MGGGVKESGGWRTYHPTELTVPGTNGSFLVLFFNVFVNFHGVKCQSLKIPQGGKGAFHTLSPVTCHLIPTSRRHFIQNDVDEFGVFIGQEILC